MLAIIIAVFAVIADQVSKWLVVQNLPNEHDKAEFIDGFLRFEHVNNPGAGWSMLDGGGWERTLLLSVSLIAMALVVYILIQYYNRHKLLTIALAMVLGGAIGNMIDRFRLKYVIDFLHTEFIHFPTFNIADCFISVGAVLLAIYIIFFDAKVEKRLLAEKQAKEAASAEETAKPTENITESPADKESENG